MKGHSNSEECFLFRFAENNDKTKAYFILIAKYQIYIQKLKWNDIIDIYAYLAYLKRQLNIEKQIYMNE